MLVSALLSCRCCAFCRVGLLPAATDDAKPRDKEYLAKPREPPTRRRRIFSSVESRTRKASS